MNQIEKWQRDEVIELLTSETAYQEILAGGDLLRARKVASMIYSMTMNTTPDEGEEMLEIESILFPQGASRQSEKNDVDIVFNAAKYMAILVTNDGGSKRQPGGILGNAPLLFQRFRVRVMTDEQAVAHVREKIVDRDSQARAIARVTGAA
ncbi:MAG TPA: hypothetical protein VJ837_02845, partial [Candidatus Paceibacterota bacterium]|nr:hypothetical protein [Candidatus Paceibacterota bacterium]